MFTPDTTKANIWKYFVTINRVECKFCEYSTYYTGNKKTLWKHLSQHSDQIRQFEASSKDSNSSVSSHNRTEETRDAATIKTQHSIPNNKHATNSQHSSAQDYTDVWRDQQNSFTDSRQLSSSPRPSTSQTQTMHQSPSRPSTPCPSPSRPSSLRHSTPRLSSSRHSSPRHSTSRSLSSYSSSNRLRSRSPISPRERECPICKSNGHCIYDCERFLKWTVPQRVEYVKLYSLCLNCLGCNHYASACRSRKCETCGQRHHTLLHPTQ